jgi:hypothetical protein
MFNSFLDSNNKLLVNRLARVQAQILALSLSTKEEYLAQVTSLINRVINTGYAMQPMTTIAPATPAVVGDPVENLLTLNDDAADIADEISRLEDDASTLFNLTAASINSVCQQIREAIYQSSGKQYVEQFVSTDKIDSSSSATVDMNAGVAQLPLSAEVVLTPTISVGQNSVGSTTSDITALSAATIETVFLWNGTSLELIVSFATPTIVNRLNITPDSYLGYEITTFTTSADGTLFADVLTDLGVDAIVLDASAGKFSGATVVDFPPQMVSKMRLVIQNRTSGSTLGIRALSFTQRSYQATGAIVSTPQTLPTGAVMFSTDELVFPPYVSITHQISSDSVNYTNVLPGPVTLGPQWWYRALLSRASTPFAETVTGVAATTADPAFSTGFTLVTSTSIPLNATTIERTLVFSGITAPIPLAETPLPNTLQLSQGNVYLPSSRFSLDDNNVLTIVSPAGNTTVTYQASAQGAAGISALEDYYTPLLSSAQFKAQ